MSREAARLRPCVLVVEDEDDARELILSSLRVAFPDVEVRAAGDGAAAWEIIRTGLVEVVVSDLVMPRLDGHELARLVRADPGTASTYIILLTGVEPPEQLFGAAEQLADDCLLKPVRWEEMVMRVRAGLRRVAVSRRLAARAAELEKLYLRQSEFLSLVSHEIRTPLSAIQSSANILLRYGQQRPESVERFARVIHQEGQRLTRLINNLLDLAKIEAGEVEWHFEPTSIGGILERLRDSFTAALGERALRLSLETGQAPATIVIDRDKLTQVLVNLVSNAIKHSPDGGEVSVRCAGPPAGGLRMEVEDEGAGIPSGDEERVFERFQQLDGGDERTGTGLGLTISRQIVEHHGGRIWAEAGRARGALFVVELPPGPRPEGDDGPV